MTYKLDPSPKGNPLLPWIYIFYSLSVTQFRMVYDKLDFPFDPPEALRNLAHDFSIAQESILGNSTPETAKTNLMEGIELDAPYVIRREELFANMFENLKRLGYADAVYRWGRQTHSYFARKELNALHALHRVLREWAVVAWNRYSVTDRPEQFSFDWERIAARYARGYSSLNLEILQLSATSSQTLQTIVLQQESKQIQLEKTMDEIKQSPKTAWEDFALRNGAADVWIREEGQFRIELQEWNLIAEVLLPDEVRILEQWAFLHKNRHRDLIIPLPKFTGII